MYKKGIIGAADPKMKEASKLRKLNDITEFNWEFYKVASKLKLRQLEIKM